MKPPYYRVELDTPNANQVIEFLFLDSEHKAGAWYIKTMLIRDIERVCKAYNITSYQYVDNHNKVWVHTVGVAQPALLGVDDEDGRTTL
jgi:hypothetical protein